MANPMRTAMAIGVSKVARSLLRLMHRGGTTLPGKAAMAIDPTILETISRDMDVIVVTGTNGKTTTCHMIEQALSAAGKDTITNRSGANLLPGVVAEFTTNATSSGKPRKHYAVMECDEGAMKQIVPLLHPKVIVVTNLFRDQLDRYGEITHTLEEIRVAAKAVPESVLCLNADCSLTASLGKDLPNRVVYFGVDAPITEPTDVDVSSARTCLRCGTPYTYRYHTFAHLGGFACPSCGYQREETQVGVEALLSMRPDGSVFRVHVPEGEGSVTKEVRCSLPAVYNIYNAIACMAAHVAAEYPVEDAIASLAQVSSSFGRMATFDLQGVPVQMILVMNPAGCNQALSFLTSVEEPFSLALSLNDRTGDGHDISWIWDVDYERVCHREELQTIYLSGDRAAELQLRLKYAGVAPEKMHVCNSDAALIEQMKESKVPVFMLPNYTAMLSQRVLLGQATGKQAYWE